MGKERKSFCSYCTYISFSLHILVIPFGLIQKAPFLEEWFKGLCSSLGKTSVEREAGNSVVYQKKQMISEAIQSLVVLYESRNLHTIVQKFEKLDSGIL